jgi:hypothetical protein
MKKTLLYVASLLILAWVATSCKDLTDCQTCKIVTRKTSDNSIVNEDGGVEKCGAEVTIYKTANPTINNPVLGTTTKVECSN